MVKGKLIRYFYLLSFIFIIGVSSCAQQSQETPPFEVGAILPLSGPSAAYGQWIQEALILVQEEVNANGGVVDGRPLKIIFEDDQGIPSSAASAMQKLVTVDEVPVVYGSWVSSSVLAMAPIAERSKTVIVAEAISPKIREAGDFVFRFTVDARIALDAFIPEVIAAKHERIAAFYINNDFGFDQADVFRQRLAETGDVLVSFDGYDPTTTDFRTSLTRLKELNVDAVFLPGYLEVATILKQAREIDFRPQFYSSFPFENERIIEIAGKAAEGVIYPFFFDANSDNALMIDYQDAYTARYGRASEGFAALAYFGMHIVVDVIQEYGGESEQIRQGLNDVSNAPTGFGEVSFDDAGDIIIPILVKTVRDGKFVICEECGPRTPVPPQ